MKSLITIAAVTLGICLISTSLARAQAGDGFWSVDFEDVTKSSLNPLVVGIDSGSGFEFTTLTDDAADGTIHLPPVPNGGSLALGVDADAEVGCDIWDLVGTDVVVHTQTSSSRPLLIVAEDVEGEALVTVSDSFLQQPTRTLTPGERLTVTDGVLAEWPGLRLLAGPEPADLADLLQTVDSRPNFTGDVIVTSLILTGTFVPEPATATLLVLALCGSCSVLLLRRRAEFASSTAIKPSV